MSSLLEWVGQRLRPYENTVERFVPSASWISKDWRTIEEQLLALAGFDAVIFIKIVVFRYLDQSLFYFKFALLCTAQEI